MLFLHLIRWDGGASSLDQSQSEVNQNQSLDLIKCFHQIIDVCGPFEILTRMWRCCICCGTKVLSLSVNIISWHMTEFFFSHSLDFYKLWLYSTTKQFKRRFSCKGLLWKDVRLYDLHCICRLPYRGVVFSIYHGCSEQDSCAKVSHLRTHGTFTLRLIVVKPKTKVITN